MRIHSLLHYACAIVTCIALLGLGPAAYAQNLPSYMEPITGRTVSSPAREKIPSWAVPTLGERCTASSPSLGSDCIKGTASPLNTTPAPKAGTPAAICTGWPPLNAVGTDVVLAATGDGRSGDCGFNASTAAPN